jgi:hypothetical protein
MRPKQPKFKGKSPAESSALSDSLDSPIILAFQGKIGYVLPLCKTPFPFGGAFRGAIANSRRPFSAIPFSCFAGFSSMAKGLTIMSIVVAILIAALFGLDLAIGVPFGRASMSTDIVFVVCSLLLGLMSWGVFREIR